ncbi:MAG: DoxX family protein [Calditrichae bacterium]|nr:DoxX family protein [Calditrichota bacterium]MCB9059635.1 DoxX family protein [Calditrichia bacterium]
MGQIIKIRNWANDHQEMGMEFLRIYLGIILFIKGVHFVANSNFLISTLMDAGQFDFANTLISHLVGIAHITGGAMMALGLITRVGALIQIPVLTGALIFVSIPKGIFTQGQHFEFTALVLFLLLLVSIFGGGELSMDKRILQKPDNYPKITHPEKSE